MPRFKIAKYRGIEYKVNSNGRIVYANRGGRGKRKWYRLTVCVRGSYYAVDNYHSKNSMVMCYTLVAIAYCKGRRPGLIPHHKDHNKLNDYYKNLEWVTHSQNIKYAHQFYKSKKKK